MQDPRFRNKEALMISKMSFPPSFDTKVRPPFHPRHEGHGATLSTRLVRRLHSHWTDARCRSALQVDMRKVEIEVMRQWISKELVNLMGFEDDVLIEYTISLLEVEDQPVRSPSMHPFVLIVLYCASLAKSCFVHPSLAPDHRRQKDATRPNRFPRQKDSNLHAILMDLTPLCSIQPYASPY